jgi:hypothetical protein
MKLQVKDWHLDFHLALEKEHFSVYAGTIVRKGSVLHGKKITKDILTPKKNGEFGKPNIKFYIIGDDRAFDNIEELVNYYENPA